jgi:HNH endonuclease
MKRSSFKRPARMPQQPAPLRPVRLCLKCGTADRYSDGHCKACTSAKNIAHRAANLDKAKARSLAWNKANSERVKVTTKEWREANKDKIKATRDAYMSINADRYKAHYIANKEKRKAWMAAWYKKNSAKLKDSRAAYYIANPKARKAATQTSNHTRRARKLAAGGKLTRNIAETLFHLQKGKCPCCAKPLGSDYHLDHQLPLALGGTNADNNMQLLRAECNQKKHAKHPVDFMQERGFLL